MADPLRRHLPCAAVELRQSLLATEDVGEFLQELATLAIALLPVGLSCGITVRRDHRPMTVANSDTRASQLDEVQYGHDQGPCLTSLATGQIVVIDDLADGDRWGPTGCRRWPTASARRCRCPCVPTAT
ncbi:GAF domain-containing protein [Pseudonocardia sp. H11422]|uniref:GAF domain-containing protein n=1 Tax=Pseudonocardia sp. H11422 TaxID=2835866 RepID=UPI001BDBF90A|nr:GAF domain-containing protein [Pseudonocardia sp. H11422]